MSLSASLNNALTGLRVSQTALSVLSSNIANANTPGYSRKTVEIANNIVDGTGYGAKVADVVRKVDNYLVRAGQQQNSVYTKSQTLSEYADRLQILLGRPGDADSIDANITAFFSAAQQLAESPEKGSVRLNFVNAGATLAKQLSGLAGGVHDLRYQADQEINAAVKNVNNAIRDLEQVNIAISYAYNNGNPTADLEDKRDALVREVSEFVDISYYYSADGQAHVTTNGGLALLEGARYELAYSPQVSAQAFASEATLAPIQIYIIDQNGNRAGTPQTLVTGGAASQVSTSMVNGKIRALLDIRDQRMPQVLEQLDQLAASVRDEVNAVHNSGTAFPGASRYMGTRLVNAAEYSQWSGEMRIALVDTSGRPITSPYADEESGVRPLTIDLAALNTGQGLGKPSVQGLINEINYAFQPQNAARLGDINNIKLVSDNSSLPGTSNLFTFDFDLENIAAENADFFVTGVQVFDSGGVDITSTTDTLPSIDLAALNTFITSPGSTTVTVNTAAAHGLNNGDWVYLSDPGAVDTIPGSEFNRFVQVKNVSATSFEIETSTPAFAGGNYTVAAQTATPRYAEAVAGDMTRTRENGTITASLAANPSSPFYIVQANITVVNDDGQIETGTVSYKVANPSANSLNRRYGAESVSGEATLSTPNTTSPLLVAKLVDANGAELGKLNDAYVQNESGYLVLETSNSQYRIAIDTLDSAQLGFPSNVPPVAGSNRGFSHYFELNNFFQSYVPTSTGDTVAGSAMAIAVESRLRTDPNLVSVGRLSQSLRPADPGKPPLYTYETTSGNNALAQSMAGLSTKRIAFAAAGGLGDINADLGGYAGQMLGYVSSEAASATRASLSDKTILDGFDDRLNAVRGVNLDEELANTIIYQNAYTASARVITVSNQLFDVLLETFRG